MRKISLLFLSLPSYAITIHIFYSPTCNDCQRTLKFLEKFEGEKGVELIRYDLSDPKNIGTLLEFYKAYDVPAERWGGTLALFVSSYCLTSFAEIKGKLPQILREKERAPPILPSSPSLPSFSLLAILSAGLLDGLNPCSLSLIALLLSLLAGVTRTRVFYLGASYILGTFIAYGLLGVGLLQIVKGIYAVSLLSLLFPPFMSLLMLFLLIVTLRQPPICRAEGYLLPILNRMRGSSSLLLFFFLGAFVSLIELFCTGQVYFPTLAYIWTEEALRSRALPLLLLYLLAFIVPLVVVVFLLWWGKRWELMGGKALVWERRFLLLFFFSMFIYFLHRSLVMFL